MWEKLSLLTDKHMSIQSYIKNQTLLDLTIASIVSIWPKNVEPRLTPKRIGGYILKQVLPKANSYQNYYIATYKKGKKTYVIKTWAGNKPDLFLFKLVHELQINKLLAAKLMPSKSPNKQRIFIPQLVEHIVGKQSLSLVFEYIEGTPLSSSTTQTQAIVILDVVKYLNQLTLSLTTDEKRAFPKRTRWFYFWSLPLVTLLALLRDIRNFPFITACLVNCVHSVLKFNDPRLVLAHRDLTAENILLTRHGIFLLDLARMTLTCPGFDLTFLSVFPQFNRLANQLRKSNKFKVQYFLANYISIQFVHAFEKPIYQNLLHRAYV